MKATHSTFLRVLTRAAAALLLAVVTARAQNTNYVIDTFDTGVPSQWWATWWGNGAINWDPAQDANGDPSSGSAYITADTIQSQNTYVVARSFGGWAWDNGVPVNFTLFTNLQIWLKWDTNVSSMPLSVFNNSGDRLGVMIHPQSANWDGGRLVSLGTVTIPEEASNRWVRIDVPINPQLAGIEEATALVFKRWDPSENVGHTIAFWIDNIELQAAVAPPPPPTVSVVPAESGLNLIASGSGQYQRQSIYTLGDTYGWVGASGPVTYSITIKRPPVGGWNGFQVHLFIAPTQDNLPWGAGDSAIDWNATNIVFVQISGGEGPGATARFMVKTNQGSGNSMLWGEGTLATVDSEVSEGTWQVVFNSDTDVTIVTPSGSSTNFTIPAEWVQYFNGPAVVHVGAQPNNTENLGKSVVLSRVQITGVPSPLDDDFSAGQLNTGLWGIAAENPAGVLVVPPTARYWFRWTLPADSDAIVMARTNLTQGGWLELATGAPVSVGGARQVLLSSENLPDSPTLFLALGKRVFTKLLVLLPGESSAPGTPTGRSGTPDPQMVWTPFDLTVIAVDDNWYPVRGVNHVITLSSEDLAFTFAGDVQMVNGTATFPGVYFGNEGTFTITATSVDDPTKTGTSSPVQVGPLQ